MKIIGIAGGKFPNQKYLVEATLFELRNIGGEYFNYLKVGDEIHVDKIYDWLVQLRNRRNQVEESRQQIRALADLMESIETVVAKALKHEESEGE